MKLNKMFAALLRYIRFYRNEINWIMLEITEDRTSIYADSKNHSFAYRTKITCIPSYLHHRLKISSDNIGSIAAMSGSLLEGYITHSGEPVSNKTLEPLPSFSKENSLMITGASISSFLDALFRIKELNNSWTEFLYMDITSKGNASCLRNMFCNRTAVIASELNTCTELPNESVCIDTFSLDILRAMLNKPSTFNLKLEKNNLYLFNKAESFSYSIKNKDDLTQDRINTITKFISMPNKDSKASLVLEKETLASLLGVLKLYLKEPKNPKEDVYARKVNFVSDRTKQIFLEGFDQIVNLGKIKPSASLNTYFSAKRLLPLVSFVSDTDSGTTYFDFGNKLSHFPNQIYFAAISCNDSVTRYTVLAPLCI